MQDGPSKRKQKKYFVMAAITDKRGLVLSIGYCSYVKTHPLQAKFAKKVNLPKKEFLHAEAMAIIRLRPEHRRKAHTITVYRFNADGSPALAKPCPVCQSMIEAAGIKHVYYTTPDNDQGMQYEQYRQHQIDRCDE